MKKRLLSGALLAACTAAIASPGSVAVAAPAAPASAPRAALTISLSQKHAGDKILLTSKVLNFPHGDRAVSYSVSFGDGSSPRKGKKLPRLLHTYTSSGPVTVKVTVKDSHGKLWHASSKIDVRQSWYDALAPAPASVSVPGCTAGTASIVTGAARPVAMPDAWYNAMYAAINLYRVANGVSALKVDAPLAQAASTWAYDIASQSRPFAHGDVPSCASGQSIAAGSAWHLTDVTPAGLLSLLVSDADHKAIMLQAHKSAVGIGVWYVPSLGEDIAVLNVGPV